MELLYLLPFYYPANKTHLDAPDLESTAGRGLSDYKPIQPLIESEKWSFFPFSAWQQRGNRVKSYTFPPLGILNVQICFFSCTAKSSTMLNLQPFCIDLSVFRHSLPNNNE